MPSAVSLQEYVSDCGEGSIKMVDNLLDILTGGEHSKSAAIIAEVL
jgi:bromodomain-containing protein 7/9